MSEEAAARPRRRGGRPRARPDQLRSHVVGFACTAGELAIIRRLAVDAGLTVRAYARGRVLGGRRSPNRPALTPALIEQAAALAALATDFAVVADIACAGTTPEIPAGLLDQLSKIATQLGLSLLGARRG